MMLQRVVIVIIISIQAVLAYSQDLKKIDSLRNLLKKEIRDTSKVKLLNDLSYEFGVSDIPQSLKYSSEALLLSKKVMYEKGIAQSSLILGNIFMEQGSLSKAKKYIDTALNFYQKLGNVKGYIHSIVLKGKMSDYNGEYEKSILYYKEALDSSFKYSYIKGQADALMYLGVIMEQTGSFDSALLYYNNAKEHYESIGDLKDVSRVNNNIGIAYYYLGDLMRAIEYYQQSLKITEELNLISETAYCYNNIGIIHEQMRNYDKALTNYKKALELHTKIMNEKGIAGCYNNIADVHILRNEYDSVLLFYNLALDKFKLLNDKRNIAFSYNIIADFLKESGKTGEAKMYYNKAEELCEEIGDFSGLAWINGGLGEVYLEENSIKQAIEYSRKAFDFAESKGELDLMKTTARTLQIAYAQSGNYFRAYNYQSIYKELSDSLFNENNIHEIAEKEYLFKYEKEKQLQEIEKQKRELKYAKEIHSQKLFRNTTILVLLFVIVIASVIYRNYRRKRNDNKILLQQKAEILEKNEELLQLNHEINAQKDEILKIHTNVTDSIKYAKKIQTALLPQEGVLKEILNEYFIIYEPLEIVSGDFFWCRKLDNILHFAVADCTGHGVPGAFMSVLGIAYLNEIMRSQTNICAGEILEGLREEIKQSLGQKGVEFETNDGMDIALCNIETHSLKACFSGAYNDLFLIRNGELKILKGDKQPIAIYDNEKPFTNYEIQLEKGDVVYMFTDGYVDQFGGELGRKFLIKNFRKLLTSIAHLSMEEQRIVLKDTLLNWKKGYPQVDDILVVGIKI